MLTASQTDSQGELTDLAPVAAWPVDGRVEIESEALKKQPRLEELLSQALSLNAGTMSLQYPNFAQWFDRKVRPGLYVGERTVCLHLIGGRPVAFMVLKHSRIERKVCALRVHPDLENRGFGVRLFERAFEVLDTRAPLLSVSELSLPKFERVFRYFGFRKAAEYEGLYLPAVREDAFNGLLTPSES